MDEAKNEWELIVALIFGGSNFFFVSFWLVFNSNNHKMIRKLFFF